MAMAALDASVRFGAEPAANDNTARPKPVLATKDGQPVVPPHPAAAPAKPLGPSLVHPAPGSIGVWIAGALAALFKRAA
jgi:hypothetical protein